MSIMTTQLELLKSNIENGASCIEAYESVDVVQMIEEGNAATANMIVEVLDLVGHINDAAGIE